MKQENPIHTYSTYLETLIRSKEANSLSQHNEPNSLITISRMEGSRGHAIAAELINLLHNRQPDAQPTWSLFDRELIQQVLQDHNLPQQLAQFMPEDKVPELQALVGEFLNLHPPLGDLFEKTCHTIIRLARIGNVVIVGRGGNMLTVHMPRAIHVRLFGSTSVRIQHISQMRGITLREAEHAIRSEDAARERFFREHFDKDINSPAIYDLVINTDHLSNLRVAQIIHELADVRPASPQPTIRKRD